LCPSKEPTAKRRPGENHEAPSELDADEVPPPPEETEEEAVVNSILPEEEEPQGSQEGM
jgi:hypothetical protein